MGKPPRPRQSLVDDGTGDDEWRVVLLRGLVTGDLDAVTSTLLAHIESLSLAFTRAMPAWKLQWDSRHWFMLGEATPLFVASAYAHAHVVQWLLRHGADRHVGCYLKQTPLQIAGECCPERVAAAAECRALLQADAEPPEPPASDAVQVICHVATEVVVIKTPATSPASSASSFSSALSKQKLEQQPQQQTIFKCLADVTWATPPANGAGIERYDVRHRLAAVEHVDALAEDDKEKDKDSAESRDPRGQQQQEQLGEAEEDTQQQQQQQKKVPFAEGNTASEAGGGNWRVEKASHNRRRLTQGLVLSRLQFHRTYEVAVRAWNAAGRGNWSRTCKFTTPHCPELGGNAAASTSRQPATPPQQQQRA